MFWETDKKWFIFIQSIILKILVCAEKITFLRTNTNCNLKNK